MLSACMSINTGHACCGMACFADTPTELRLPGDAACQGYPHDTSSSVMELNFVIQAAEVNSAGRGALAV